MVASGDKKVLKTRDRSTQILPEMIGFTFAVHNGKQFISVYVTEQETSEGIHSKNIHFTFLMY